MKIPTHKLLAELEAVTSELGEPPTREQMDDQGEYASQTYVRRFGSWNAALREADLEVNKRQDIASEDLLEDLRRLHESLEKIPSKHDVAEHGQFSPKPYLRRFDSWNEAVNQAGMVPRDSDGRIPRQILIQDLQRVAEVVRRDILITEDIKCYGRYSVDTYRNKFGEWPGPLKAAGLPHTEDASTVETPSELTSQSQSGTNRQRPIQDE